MKLSQLILLGESSFLGRALPSWFRHKFEKLYSISSLNCDLSDPEAVSIMSVDWDSETLVLFFSAVSKGKKNTVESYDTNLKMARNVAHAARSKQVLGVIFTSSIDIYGNCPINPLTEKSFIQANSWYSKSKKESEIILQTMLDGEIPLGIFRCPGIYDLSSCDRSVIGNFTRRAQENKILKVHNSGENMRDFIYAGDLYELFYLWFKKPVTGIWNVATGNSCSMLDVVEQIVKNVGLGSIEITEEGHRNFNQVFDCTAILETFGANPLRPFYDAFPDVYLSL